jgi:hypothetical protein
MRALFRTTSPSSSCLFLKIHLIPMTFTSLGGSTKVQTWFLGVYIPHLNVPLLYMISQKVVSPLNMSHLFVEDWIFGY